jgi:hypothetical protein
MSNDTRDTGSWYELSRPHNPWEKFTRRDEKKHVAEDSRLCPSTATTSDVIRLFLAHGIHRLDDPVPRQRQLLKDFLNAAVPSAPSSSMTYSDEVQKHSTHNDIALLDDRSRHLECAKMIGQPCTICYIVPKNFTISELCTHMRDVVCHIKQGRR